MNYIFVIYCKIITATSLEFSESFILNSTRLFNIMQIWNYNYLNIAAVLSGFKKNTVTYFTKCYFSELRHVLIFWRHKPGYAKIPRVIQSLFSMCYWHIKSSIHDEIKCRLKAGNSGYYSVQTLLSSRLLSKNLKIKIYSLKQ